MERYTNPAEQEAKVKSFQEKHLPEGMRSQKKVNLIISAGLELTYARQADIEGMENLPEK